ncbi:MAG: PH domain-containing protein [Clostridia bacterium]|nr:PH domain-containing protein [Clostridia bacterium]
MAKEKLKSVFFEEDEKILYTAKVSRRIIPVFSVAVAILLFLAFGSIRATLLNFNNPALEMRTKLILLALDAATVVLSIVLPFWCRSMLRRQYVITDRKVVIDQGGMFIRGRRALLLQNVNGVELKNNFAFSIVNACTVSFYSICDPPRSKTFLIFSMTKNSYKFQLIRREDGERIYEMMQKIMQNGGAAED